jgi:SAM-dependent methyltransferase
VQRVLSAFRRRLLRAFRSKGSRRHGLVGPPRLWKMKRDFQIRFLKDQGLKPEHYLLDIGCGTLRGGIPLIRHLEPGHYFGIEVSAARLEEGRRELREAGLEEKHPTLLLAPNMAKLKIDRKYDFIWAFSVLVHMSDPVLEETLDFVSDHLSGDGAFYANVNIGERKEGRWREFPIVGRSFDFYRDACAAMDLAVADLGPLSELGHVSGVHTQDRQRMLRITHR